MSLSLAARGDQGLFLSKDGNYSADQQLDNTKNCKVTLFNHAGTKIAWSDGKQVKILDLQNHSNVITISTEKTQFMQWSPKDTYLATWEVFAVRNGKQEPNLRLWSATNGDLKAAFIQRKADGWDPRWSPNEDLVAIKTMNNEVAYFKDCNFDKIEKKLSLAKMDSFSVSPSGNHVVAFVPGQKGAPGFAKLFAFPNFNPEKDVLAYKSFMLADKMEAKWSTDSKNVLLLMQSEVDKTGASYYGKSQLHFMNIEGETSFVQLGKEGPIYHVEWAPNVANFCVVYGFMPAKATLYNKKCEKVFDFGTGARNMALFNVQGSLLMLGGFGNLRGSIEMWDLENKKQVASFEAPDSTDVTWSPDGQHILTTTCAPRLRIGNGYKIWHYTSTLLHETHCKDPTANASGEELWEAVWRPKPEAGKAKFAIKDKPIAGGITPLKPQASKQAYVPPNQRGKAKTNTKLHDEDELPENLKNKGDQGNLSKSAAKNKKRREAAKKKKEDESEDKEKEEQKAQVASTGDPEKDKKIRKINDKLAQISKLKEQVKAGKQLEANQLDKIKKEAEFLKELKQLTI